MVVELSEETEQALLLKAAALGMNLQTYVKKALEQEARPISPKSSYGSLAHCFGDLSAEDIDENRKEMLKGSIFDPEVV